VLLKIRDLKTYFFIFRGTVRAIDGVSFDVFRGEALGLVGESGSGKTVTGLSILRLVQPPGRIVAGDIQLNGQSLLALSEPQMQDLRGSQISMIFQNPRTALNPVMRIGDQIDRVYRQHTGCSTAEARDRRLAMLRRVSIGQPETFSRQYPHQISGGMCQRAMIVMALVCKPELIIADEPTTGLDVTIQRQIMELLAEMREQLHATQILITHDLGVVAETCDRVVVMYASLVMEVAPTEKLFSQPAHPYTLGLLKSVPRLDVDYDPAVMPGNVPRAAHHPTGCPFHPRCPLAQDVCRKEAPNMVSVSDNHIAACHFVEKVVE
jgi:oligopeptide/dipeptide ABC transporter ATP-binding protein